VIRGEDNPVRRADLPLKYRLMLASYPWRRSDAVSPARLRRPLTEARVALVSTAGLVPPGEQAFDLDRRGGDPSFRLIPAGTDPRRLSVHHRSEAFDRRPLEADPGVVFPSDRLSALAERGTIGSVAPRHLSFMGSITAPGRLRREFAPRAADLLAADGVDVALLVPV
jgi:D-proline reductase (dithiol) PrdB